MAKHLFKPGKWPKFLPAARMNDSNSKVYSLGEVPELDAKDEDYIAEITIHVADPDYEKKLAGHCVRAINSAPTVLDAMTYALEKLDSVAFLSKEGDTTVAKESLRGAIAKLTGEDY